MTTPQYYVAGRVSTHVLRFTVNGQYVPADVGSVSYTLRGPTGTAIDADVPVTINDGDTFAVVHVSADKNTKTSDIESRFLEFNFEVSGFPHFGMETYSLTDFIPMTCSADDVRDVLGLTPFELPSPSVDLTKSFYALKKMSLTTPILDMLSSDAVSANRMIVLHCALGLLPSCQARAAKQQVSGSESFTRGTVDWKALENSIRTELDGMILSVSSNVNNPTLFGLSSQTDPMYGDTNAS